MKAQAAEIPDLAAVRSGRGISLREIADRTKIRMYYLQAIEKGRFDALPEGVYARSYVRQYAEAIGLDEDLLLRFVPAAEHEHFPPPPAPGNSVLRKLLQLAFPRWLRSFAARG